MIRKPDARQTDLFAPSSSDEVEADVDTNDRALIDQLIADTNLYSTADDHKALVDFVVRFPKTAPFNAMLLHIQKPGVTYVLSPAEWQAKFGRTIKPDARPLIILWPFGPVAFVFDILDTDGPALPPEAFTFPTLGKVPVGWDHHASQALWKKGIPLDFADKGDSHAGYVSRSEKRDGKTIAVSYRVVVNRNHDPATQVTTLAHELAHLFLGHLGTDHDLKIKAGSADLGLQEVEAECVAYIVAVRSGLTPRSDKYLSNYKDDLSRLDHHKVLQTAGVVEKLMGMPFLKKAK